MRKSKITDLYIGLFAIAVFGIAAGLRYWFFSDYSLLYSFFVGFIAFVINAGSYWVFLFLGIRTYERLVLDDEGLKKRDGTIGDILTALFVGIGGLVLTQYAVRSIPAFEHALNVMFYAY